MTLKSFYKNVKNKPIEPKRNKRKPRETKSHLTVYAKAGEPDPLLDALKEPLPPEISKQIKKLSKKGLRRSEIAKQLKLPTIFVTQELIRLTEPAGIVEHRKKCGPKKKKGGAA